MTTLYAVPLREWRSVLSLRILVAVLLAILSVTARAKDAPPRIDLDAETMAYLEGTWSQDAVYRDDGSTTVEVERVFEFKFSEDSGQLYVGGDIDIDEWLEITSVSRSGDAIEIEAGFVTWIVQLAPPDGLAELDYRLAGKPAGSPVTGHFRRLPRR